MLVIVSTAPTAHPCCHATNRRGDRIVLPRSYELAKPENLRVLRKLQAEVDTHLPAEERPTTPQQLAPCAYLECVLQEALRRHPVVPQVNRRGMGGDTTTVCGRRFPAGTQFLLNFRAVAWSESRTIHAC